MNLALLARKRPPVPKVDLTPLPTSPSGTPAATPSSACKVVEAALGNLAMASKPYIVKVEHGFVYIRAQVGNAIILVQAKVAVSAEAKALGKCGGSKVKEAVGPRVVAVRALIGDTMVTVKTKCGPLVEKSDRVRISLEKSILKAAVKASAKCAETQAFRLVRLSEPIVVKARGKNIRVSELNRIEGFAAALKRIEGFAASRAFEHRLALEKYACGLKRIEGADAYACAKVKGITQTEASKAQTTALSTYAVARKMVGDRVAPVANKVFETYGSAKTKALTIADGTKTMALTVVGDKQFQATAAGATTGAVALGASAGAAGFVTGGTIGAAVGVVPALLTFGLSIPIGAAIGAASGLCIGTAAGSTVGLVGGGAVGYRIQMRKKEISEGASGAMSKESAAAMGA